MYNISGITTLYLKQRPTANNDGIGVFKTHDCMGRGPITDFDNTYDGFFRKIRDMRRAGFDQPITLKIIGSYYTNKPITIPEDIYDVTIEGDDENSFVSGGVPIKNWYDATFNGVKCLAAKVSESVADAVDLVVCEKYAENTRYPEDGYLYCEPESVETKNGGFLGGSRFFSAKEGDLDNIDGIENANVGMFHLWVHGHSPIESYDKKTRRITMKRRTAFNVYIPNEDDSSGHVMKYWLENIPSTFTKENQWYFDKDNLTVYYIPPKGVTKDNIEAVMPVARSLFNVKGKNIGFKKLKFLHTTSDHHTYCSSTDANERAEDNIERTSDVQSTFTGVGAINFEHTSGCFVENCKISFAGVHGIAVCEGSSCIRIENNELAVLGAGGIKIIGSNDKDDVSNHTYSIKIRNNLLKNGGIRHWASCGILIMHSHDNEISHNEIDDFKYSGISCGWVWGYKPSMTYNNIIEYNYISHIGYGALSDMGGIYTLGPQRGTVLRNNIIHGVRSYRYCGCGIYNDEGSSYIRMENNIVIDAQFGYMQHYGKDNILKNNIFIQDEGSAMFYHVNEMHSLGISENNIFYLRNDSTLYESSNCNKIPGNRTSRNNLIFVEGENRSLITLNSRKECEVEYDYKGYNLEKIQTEFGLEENTVIADPEFVNINSSLELKSTSPAIALGFTNIDTKFVGRIK